MILGIVYLVQHFLLKPGSKLFQRRALPALERIYDKFISLALKIPVLITGGTLVLLVLSFMVFFASAPKVVFFPSADPLYVNAFVELPIGSDIEATDRLTMELEQKISHAIKDYGGVVEAVLTQIGENTSDPNNPPEPGASPTSSQDHCFVCTFPGT